MSPTSEAVEVVGRLVEAADSFSDRGKGPYTLVNGEKYKALMSAAAHAAGKAHTSEGHAI